MKEYKIAKGWAIFIYLCAPLLIGLFGWLLILSFKNGGISPSAGYILIPISIVIIAIMVYSIIDSYKGKLIIGKDSIKSITTFANIELKIGEIKGFTVNDQYIFIEPKDKGKKGIKISKYIGSYSEILFWLSQNFPDLDLQNAIEEEEAILNDESLGWTKEIREVKLAKARKISKMINWAAGISAGWIIFFPNPYPYSILTAIVIPIIALLAVRFFDGLIRIDEKNGSAYPSVVYAFVFPSLGLMLRALLDYNIFDYSNVWLTTGLITLTFLLFLLSKQQEITFKKKLDYVSFTFLVLFLFAYSFGAVIHLNCYYDNSDAQNYRAKVLDKRVSSGRNSTTYYFELSTWGQQEVSEEVSVSKSLYNKIDVNNEVNIYFRNGKLKIPWFIVKDK